ncbi:hypothetical protein GCM10010271_61190 [Streptomyces kurssanovii]|nr:hypothetical protein GCM10010271_61190 [Streptomyces kurssanovii]
MASETPGLPLRTRLTVAPDVLRVAAEPQAVEGDLADRRALSALGHLVRPETEAGLGVEAVTALAGA